MMECNAKLGISKTQEEAMKVGSQRSFKEPRYGWAAHSAERQGYTR